MKNVARRAPSFNPLPLFEWAGCRVTTQLNTATTVVRVIARRHNLPIHLARLICDLSGIGDGGAR